MLLLIVAVFISKEYTVEREVIVNKSNAEAFNYFRYEKNQDSYNKWLMSDRDAKKNPENRWNRGFVYAWDGNKKVGKGEQQIKNIEGRTAC